MNGVFEEWLRAFEQDLSSATYTHGLFSNGESFTFEWTPDGTYDLHTVIEGEWYEGPPRVLGDTAHV